MTLYDQFLDFFDPDWSHFQNDRKWLLLLLLKDAALYQELANMDDPIVAKDTINFELAKIYEKQDKKKEAADLYYNIAKTASEAKDSDGKPVRMTETATDAKKKLQELDPERAKEIAEAPPENPFGP